MAMRAVAFAVLLAACSPAAGGDLEATTSFNVVRFPPEAREVAPPVEGEMLFGDPVDLTGTVAVVNFWGSWCGPCREEQPRLESLWKRFGSQGVVSLGIDTRRDQRAAALAFIEEFDVTYPSIYDPDSRIAADFRVVGMPTTIVIDARGRIAARITGAVRSEEELAGILRDELDAA